MKLAQENGKSDTMILLTTQMVSKYNKILEHWLHYDNHFSKFSNDNAFNNHSK